MSKINRTPRERTEVSVAKLVEVADEIERDVVSELRRIADKMKAKGVPFVAVTGRTNSEKARGVISTTMEFYVRHESDEIAAVLWQGSVPASVPAKQPLRKNQRKKTP